MGSTTATSHLKNNSEKTVWDWAAHPAVAVTADEPDKAPETAGQAMAAPAENQVPGELAQPTTVGGKITQQRVAPSPLREIDLTNRWPLRRELVHQTEIASKMGRLSVMVATVAPTVGRPMDKVTAMQAATVATVAPTVGHPADKVTAMQAAMVATVAPTAGHPTDRATATQAAMVATVAPAVAPPMADAQTSRQAQAPEVVQQTGTGRNRKAEPPGTTLTNGVTQLSRLPEEPANS